MVLSDLHIDATPSKLLARLSVTQVSTTQAIAVTYTNADPHVAQERAQAFAEDYLSYKRTQALNGYQAVQGAIQAQITSLQRELLSQDAKAANAPAGSVARQQALTQHDLLTGQIAILQAQLVPLSKITINPGEIVQTAQLPKKASSPNFPLEIVLALFVGFALAIGIAFLRERLDDGLAGGADLEGRLGAPVLAVIPKIPTWRRRNEARLVMMEGPRSAAAEAYRGLRTSFQFITTHREAKTILVTSPSENEGKTTTTVNLAVALANADNSVVVVSADLRKPRIHRFLNQENDKGVVDVLLAEASLEEAIADTEVRNLRLVPSGPVPGNPAELLQSKQMGELIGSLRDRFDFVLIDSAPVLPLADTFALAPVVDAVLLVTDAQTTTRSAVVHAKQKLEQVGGRIIGAVFNDFDQRRAKTYGTYRYGYGYGYRYGAKSAPEGNGQPRKSRRADEARKQ